MYCSLRVQVECTVLLGCLYSVRFVEDACMGHVECTVCSLVVLIGCM